MKWLTRSIDEDLAFFSFQKNKNFQSFFYLIFRKQSISTIQSFWYDSFFRDALDSWCTRKYRLNTCHMDADRMRTFEKKFPIYRINKVKKFIKSSNFPRSHFKIYLISDSTPEIRSSNRHKISFKKNGFIIGFDYFPFDSFNFFFKDRFESEWTSGKNSHDKKMIQNYYRQ